MAFKDTTTAIDALRDAVDEYCTLTVYTNSSSEDLKNDVIDYLRTARDELWQLHDDLIDIGDDNNYNRFNLLVDDYMLIFKTIVSYKIDDISLYSLSDDLKLFKQKEPIPPTSLSPISMDQLQPKSVRFKNNLVEASPSALFKPYKDNDQEENDIKPYKDSLFSTLDNIDDSELDNPTIDMSNSQIFIHNQHQFDSQDTRLDELHNSVKQQKQLSMNINNEVTHQFVILNDLENGITHSSNRLVRANNNLSKYREALKKRGDWMCIIILIVVLLFILIFIK